MIRSKNLHIGYSETLLKVDDLHLDAGVYILVGKNGSGKSTFLKTLTATIPAISGTISLNEKSVHSLSESERPKKIAFVQTQFPVVDFLTVSEYLALGRSPHTAFFGKLSKHDRDMVESALEVLGISYLASRFTNQLSDGERQMVAIARTFAQGADLIALDEPTAFLDYQNKVTILKQLIALGESHNKCIILSSHDIDQSVQSGADFLVVHSKDRRLIHLNSKTTKEELIHNAF